MIIQDINGCYKNDGGQLFSMSTAGRTKRYQFKFVGVTLGKMQMRIWVPEFCLSHNLST